MQWTLHKHSSDLLHGHWSKLGLKGGKQSPEYEKNLTTITVELGFLGDFVLLFLKTCSLYHEKLFIQKVNDISSQVFNNFFSASDIMEAVRGRFCFYRYECKVA